MDLGPKGTNSALYTAENPLQGFTGVQARTIEIIAFKNQPVCIS